MAAWPEETRTQVIEPLSMEDTTTFSTTSKTESDFMVGLCDLQKKRISGRVLVPIEFHEGGIRSFGFLRLSDISIDKQ